MALKNFDEYKGAASKRYNALSRWRPFEHKQVDWFDAEWMFGAKDFDIVIANPPYLGEKGHSELFRKIKADGLEKFYLGKMDLFYFFFHHAINLANESGVVAFITTNYYPTAYGARKLRKDFYERTSILELINFNELKIFESALGQHNLITILSKGPVDEDSTNIIMSEHKGLASTNLLSEVLSRKSDKAKYITSAKKSLFDGKEYYIRFTSDGDSNNGIESLLNKVASQGKTLSLYCNVNQGIVSGADKFSDRHSKKYPNIQANKNDGVFVLKRSEIESSNFKESELKFFKPWFKNSDVHKYNTSMQTDTFLLNLTYTQRASIDDLPQINAHVAKYEELLKNRPAPGTLQSAYKNGYWWVLTTSRRQDFDGPKILAPQRSMRNTFGYNEIPWYAASDVFYITNKGNDVNLKYILGLINSKLYYIWLYHRGKRKGETLELIATPLSEMPIKFADISVQDEVSKLVDEILLKKSSDKNLVTSDLESRIDHLVYEIYDLTSEEIDLVERNA